MKIWLQSLALSLVLVHGSCAQAKNASTTENIPSDIELSSPQQIAPSLHQEFKAPINDQPAVVSEYRNMSHSACVVEFTSVSHPVNLQPPTIRPTGASPHVQEFGKVSLGHGAELPLETYPNAEPASFIHGSHPAKTSYALPETNYRHDFKKLSGKKNSAMGKVNLRIASLQKNEAPTRLIPVQHLVVYPLSTHQ